MTSKKKTKPGNGAAQVHALPAAPATSTGPAKKLNPTDEGGNVVCLDCGESFQKLGMHLSQIHKLKPDAYRKKHGLDKNAPLKITGTAAPGLRFHLVLELPTYDVRNIGRITMVAARYGKIVTADLDNMPKKIKLI